MLFCNSEEYYKGNGLSAKIIIAQWLEEMEVCNYFPSQSDNGMQNNLFTHKIFINREEWGNRANSGLCIQIRR